MVGYNDMNVRLQQRLRSLKFQEQTSIRRARKKIKDSFKKLREGVYEHHYTRVSVTALHELFDDHELLRERMQKDAEIMSTLERKCITTFVGFKLKGNASQYYVLSPATMKGRQSCALSRNLAAHIHTSISATHTALKCSDPDEIIYHCFPHPFLFYQLNGSDRYIKKFHPSFINLVTASQPRQFTSYHFEHRIDILPQEALNRLKHRDWDELFKLEEQLVSWNTKGRIGIPYQELVSVLNMGEITIKRLVTQRDFEADGKGCVSLQSLYDYYDIEQYKIREELYRVRNKLNFNGQALEERRQEALLRLAGKENSLSFKDIAYVLGISVMSAKELSRIQSRNNVWKNVNFKRGRGHKAMIPSNYISSYINSYDPTNQGWRKHVDRDAQVVV
ncbi:hypothetical protein FJZ18_01405 [Candidatus Pacearchaeota archaeon]|nr:hypothetical protein [Candidatus Pacearchaeota archaeon]